MTKQDIVRKNIKAMIQIAYIAKLNAEDPTCPDVPAYKDRAERSVDNLINYILEETA